MRSPMRPEAPPSVADWRPPVPRIAPTIPPTMPLRIKPAPRAVSRPRITLIQLVPRSSARAAFGSRAPRRSSPRLSVKSDHSYSKAGETSELTPLRPIPRILADKHNFWRLPPDAHVDPLLALISHPPHLAKPIFTQRAYAYPSVLSEKLA
jgi:hypothetical protein